MAIPPEEHGERDGGAEVLSATFYGELRGIAERMFSSERSGHTLQPTAVVHEACIRIMGHGLPALAREQQLALAARVLKQVLIDHARVQGAAKRGGRGVRLALEEELACGRAVGPAEVEAGEVVGAIERLRALHERQGEVVTLRILGGLTMAQIAEVLGTSKRTVEGDWAVARAWLRRELSTGDGEHGS